MKKIVLIVLTVIGAIGTIYYATRTNNNENGATSPRTLPAKGFNQKLIDKITQEKKKLNTVITLKNTEKYKTTLNYYNGVLSRAKNIAQKRPFPYTKNPDLIINTLNHILFDEILDANKAEQLIPDEIEELDILVEKIQPSINGIEDAIDLNNTSLMKQYIEEYKTVLDNAQEASEQLETLEENGQQPDIIDVLDYMI